MHSPGTGRSKPCTRHLESSPTLLHCCRLVLALPRQLLSLYMLQVVYARMHSLARLCSGSHAAAETSTQSSYLLTAMRSLFQYAVTDPSLCTDRTCSGSLVCVHQGPVLRDPNFDPPAPPLLPPPPPGSSSYMCQLLKLLHMYMLSVFVCLFCWDCLSICDATLTLV